MSETGLHDSLAEIVDAYETGGTGNLYEDLAPLYDFIYQRHFDYDEQLALVTDVAPADATRVLEGACGPGHLLARLETRYDHVVGVDNHAGMLDRARANTTSATLVEADLLEYEPDATFDVVAILGNALTHFDADAVSRLFERVASFLAPGGVFVCDFMPVEKLTDGYTSDRTWSDDRFDVRRTTETRVQGGGRHEIRFAYEITDTLREKTAHVEEMIPAQAHDPAHLIEVAERSGFSLATEHEHPTWGVLVAQI